MNVFPLIQRRFNEDKLCREHCRQIYDSYDPIGAQGPFVTVESEGGENVSTFATDASELDLVFVCHSGAVKQEKVHAMVDAISRAFSDQRLTGGDFAAVSIRRAGPPSIQREDKTYSARLPFSAVAVLATQTPAVTG